MKTPLVLALAIAGSSLAQSVGAQSPASAPSPNEFPELKKEQDRLTLENSIADLKQKQALRELAEQKAKLELENQLAQQRLANEIAQLNAEITALTQKIELANKRAALAEAQQKEKLADQFRTVKAQIEELKVNNELLNSQLEKTNKEAQVKLAQLQAREKELAIERAEFDIKVAKVNAEMDLWEKKDRRRNFVDREPAYSTEPYKDGILTISDRRIPLNGPITTATADYIAERIDFFNNQSPEYPIFLVIDRSPGGSVMAGYKILKAMEGSRAPVYVVVKSFAASMAAGITTMATRSFAYPNAIILHHQILSGNFGNLTEQKESVRELDEWWRRLATPVAKKMGLSLDEFVKEMYKNRSTGDWVEFADSAKKLKWVDEVVESVREDSYLKNPNLGATTPKSDLDLNNGRSVTPDKELDEKIDSEGRPYVILPRLDPFDCYYLYNPDRYYRAR